MRYRISDIDQNWGFWTDSIISIVEYTAYLKYTNRNSDLDTTMVGDYQEHKSYTLREFIGTLI